MATEEKQESKKCPACDKDISSKASRCPYCRQDLRSWFGRHPILTVIGLIFTFGIVMSVSPQYNSSNKGGSPTPTQSNKKEVFEAEVNFTGTQFVIKNVDDYDCVSARMEINGGLFKGGYSLDGYTLEAGNQYEVGAMQFTQKDGTRFSPYTTKPQSFNINCGGNNELSSAFWYGQFE